MFRNVSCYINAPKNNRKSNAHIYDVNIQKANAPPRTQTLTKSKWTLRSPHHQAIAPAIKSLNDHTESPPIVRRDSTPSPSSPVKRHNIRKARSPIVMYMYIIKHGKQYPRAATANTKLLSTLPRAYPNISRQIMLRIYSRFIIHNTPPVRGGSLRDASWMPSSSAWVTSG